MKIYLDNQITIKGITIGHTPEGLKYLIEHWEYILKISTPQQMAEKDRQHCELMIANYKIHLDRYQHIEQPTTINQQPTA